jgi:hypothetical protein
MKVNPLIIAVVFCAFASGGADSGNEKKTPAPTQQKEGDGLANLAKARRDAAEKAYKSWRKNLPDFRSPDTIYLHSIMWLNAELEIATKKEERVAAYKAHLDRTKDWAVVFERNTGPTGRFVDTGEAYQREAEYWLSRELSGGKGR